MNSNTKTFSREGVADLLSPDLTQAKDFLKCLDPKAERFLFSAFSERADLKESGLGRPQKLHCTLAEATDQLTQWNNEGYGIYVGLQGFKPGTGRKNADVEHIRANVLDDDEPKDKSRDDLPLPPHIIVETSHGKYQYIWLTDGKMSPDEFKNIQDRLIESYGNDPQVKDLARVVRLPGFYHQKKEPFLSRIISQEVKFDHYTSGQMLEAFPPVANRASKNEHIVESGDELAVPDWWEELSDDDKNAELDRMLAVLPQEVVEDQDKWLSVMAACLRSGATDAEEICRQWSRKSKQHSDTEFNSRYRSYVNTSSGPPITMFSLEKMALENGYEPKYQEVKFPPVPDHLSGNITPAAEATVIPELPGGKYSKKKALELMNQKYFTATWGNTYTICEHTADGSFRVMSDKEFRLATQNKMVISKNEKQMTIGKFWLGHPKRKEYERVVFDPKKTPENCINLYRGCGMKPVSGDCSLLIKHIFEVICNGDKEHFEYLMNLLALRVQQPWRKLEVALVMRSEKEGTGKGTFAGWVMDMVGRDYSIHATSRDQVVGRFNKHLETCLVLFADEAMFTGDKKHDPVLKTMISEKTIMIENKYEKAYQTVNRSFVIIATNQDHSIIASASARRIFSPTVSEKYAQDSAYFIPLNEQAKAGGVAALLHELIQRDISLFDHRQVPKTSELLEQQINSLDSIDQWLLSVAEQERLVIPCDIGCRENLLGEWVLGKDVTDAYLHWCREHRISFIETENTVGSRMNKLGIPRKKEPRNASNRNGRMFPSAENLKSLVLGGLNAAK